LKAIGFSSVALLERETFVAGAQPARSTSGRHLQETLWAVCWSGLRGPCPYALVA
jgi:hypothetical protein